MATSHRIDVIPHIRRAVLLRDGAGLTDGELLESYLRSREEMAFAALVQRHGPMVWGVCRRLLGNHHDAEEAFQATFLVLVHKAASIVPREMVANWLYGVAHQTALKARALAARRRMRERQVEQMPEPYREQDIQDDLRPLLDLELSRLPDKYRAVIVLCDLEARTRQEVARQLGLPEGTVASRLATARTMLGKRLVRRGVVLSGGALATALAQGAATAEVPASVVSSTIQAANLFAAGGALAVAMKSARVAALTEGVLKTMLRSRFGKLMMLLGTLAILVPGLVLSAYHASAQQPVNEKQREQFAAEADKPEKRKGSAARPDKDKSDRHYCWLAFGPERKLRVLVRLDGKEVAIDRNGDGKFDGKGERFESEEDCKGVVLADPDGKTSYVIQKVHLLHVVPPEKFLAVWVHVRGPVDYFQTGEVRMAEDQKAAREIHFHGPLTIASKTTRIANRATRLLENDLVNLGWLVPEEIRRLAGKDLFVETELPKSLARTGEPTKLWANLLTEGESSVVAVASPDEKDGETSSLPKGVQPSVEVRFPGKKPDDPVIVKRYPLEHLRHGIFRGPVRVPDEAGSGKAEVTFSLEGWKGVKVAPTTAEIPLAEPREEKKGRKE
jgi:RNA polymerase sigma factor (sigma-70 family)